jgi:hypothetical protein
MCGVQWNEDWEYHQGKNDALLWSYHSLKKALLVTPNLQSV